MFTLSTALITSALLSLGLAAPMPQIVAPLTTPRGYPAGWTSLGNGGPPLTIVQGSQGQAGWNPYWNAYPTPAPPPPPYGPPPYGYPPPPYGYRPAPWDNTAVTTTSGGIGSSFQTD
jgi:hypothetical protein